MSEKTVAAAGPRTLSIINDKGLHARASAKFVATVEGHDASATVTRDGMDVAGDSIMGLLMLAAAKGSTIEVETEGPEAEALLDALDALVAGRFGEES
ncbi:HPr family phosphocarrier protein [Rhodovulum sp. DZ06]|uniref:HPr family phosphocarrier protein n=1 Tax=Rhodovulum sp. DZ06 TaxID=3425126 RepID=UPI003D357850